MGWWLLIYSHTQPCSIGGGGLQYQSPHSCSAVLSWLAARLAVHRCGAQLSEQQGWGHWETL